MPEPTHQTPLQAYPIRSTNPDFGMPVMHQIEVDGSRCAVPANVKCQNGDVLMIVSKQDWELARTAGLIIFNNDSTVHPYTFNVEKR